MSNGVAGPLKPRLTASVRARSTGQGARACPTAPPATASSQPTKGHPRLCFHSWSIDGTKALLTEHPFSAVPLSRVIGPRKRPVLAAPPPQVQVGRADHPAMAERKAQVRDARVEVVPEALHHCGELAPSYTHPHMLVIDEVGYLSYGPDAANVLFQVVNDRYLHHRPMIFTNKPLGA